MLATSLNYVNHWPRLKKSNPTLEDNETHGFCKVYGIILGIHIFYIKKKILSLKVAESLKQFKPEIWTQPVLSYLACLWYPYYSPS